MANHVTTEWEDIHVKLGNYLPREKEESNDEIQKKVIESIQNYDPLDKKTLNELNEIDDFENDEVLKKYKEKRLKELKEFNSKPHFGKLYELRKQDYIQEVTNAPKDVYVILLLYQNYLEDCLVLSKILEKLAQRFILVKFMRIIATDCIEKFSDKDCPGIIIYYNGKLFRQLIPATYYFGGSGRISSDKVEWILGSLKIIKSEVEEDPFDEDNQYYAKGKKKFKDDSDDDKSDSDDDGRLKKDREYSWTIIRK